MRRAFAWVTLIVLLSFATIAALNYWAPGGRALPARAGMQPPNAEALPAPRILAGHRGAGPIHESQGGLSVEVHRSYAGFVLAASFSSSSSPLGLLGASGSGKSMTLRCIAGLEKPESGRIVLNGRVLLDTAKHVNMPPAQRRIGMVFQDYALFPHLTVRQNIGFGLDRSSGKEQEERIGYWSRMMQIDPLLDAYPGELSGGQRQRVALARALAREPDALLLDEPLSALDPHLRRQMEEHLRVALEHYRGVTIFVTHDRDEAFRSCEDLVVLSDGKVVASGPKRAIFAHPRSLAVARLTGCKNIAAIVHTEPRQIRVEDWGCTLDVDTELPAETAYVGIRAHEVRIVTRPGGNHTFPCWLVSSIESPFETTLYLRLHDRPNEGDRAHLEAEVSRAEWAELASAPQPWYVILDPAALLFLQP
jgi:molybdate transport system permease protein